ncbi:MAG TPA: hypothetical protein VFR33_07850 [Candidatus Dormibacteraeota bacterium]|nr:hypothetical protein [Candidatus Dormibacteraeota bacterium]
MAFLGTVLALVLLVLLAIALWWTWRRPFLGLGFLVAGMAFHNFLLMVLLRLETPLLLVRAFQAWKELLIALLVLVAALTLWRRGRFGWMSRLSLFDWLAIAFAALTVVYFLLPGSFLHSGATFAQRLVGFRLAILIPVMYLLGRSIQSSSTSDGIAVLWLCVGSAAVVSALGIVELALVPTRTWLDWGVNQYTGFLGFTYHGPKGLPENFFVTLPDGTLLRRMVSTYVSPLGIAYTGLLVFPLGVALIEHLRGNRRAQRLAAIALALIVVGLLLSVTRLAVISLVGEAALLFLMLRRRWLAILVPVLLAGVVIVSYPYASVGPAVDRNLSAVTRSHWQWVISGNDTSANEHYTYLIRDFKIDLEHPLGLGTGASTVRYGQLVGTGESALLGFFGDLGIAGGFVYVALYALAIWNGFRGYILLRGEPVAGALALTAAVGGLALLPITATSDVWGDLSVTFLFWWAAGAGGTIAATAAVPARFSRRRAEAGQTGLA